MVMKGQFLERPTLIPLSPGVVLEGLWHRGDKRPPVLILPPTPDEGSSMDHVVAAEVAWACATRGFPSLRFNFQGVGGSQGVRGSRGRLIDDAEQALRLLQDNASCAEAVCVSIGASAPIALELARRHPALAGLCFVSPMDVGPNDLSALQIPLRVIIGALDVRQPRVALASAVTEGGGQVDVIEEADQAFTRNLAEVGRSVAEFVLSLSA